MSLIGFPDGLISAILFDTTVIVILALWSFAYWVSGRKRRWLKNYKMLEENFNHELKSAVWKMFAYLLFAAPVTILMLVGANTLVATHPSWYVPLLLLMVFAPITLMVYFVLYPLVRLCSRFAALGAVAIDEYVKQKYPLDYFPVSPLCQS
jgi:1-acyl-sn-glycerol-3-phosphate acyltransferase